MGIDVSNIQVLFLLYELRKVPPMLGRMATKLIPARSRNMGPWDFHVILVKRNPGAEAEILDLDVSDKPIRASVYFRMVFPETANAKDRLDGLMLRAIPGRRFSDQYERLNERDFVRYFRFEDSIDPVQSARAYVSLKVGNRPD